MITLPRALYVSGSSIEQYESESWSEIERDPRGLVLMWSPPNPRARYIMGCDPTVGISEWSRATRTDGDKKTDNAAIEIFEVDGASEIVYEVNDAGKKVPVIDPSTQREKRLYRDLQVCEYAAPIDAVEAARVCNILGRIYAGDQEDQCKLIWEAYPGPGMLTTQELLRLGYGNMWMWQHIDSVVEDTNRMGWRSTRESQKILWYRTRRHLLNRQALIRSKFLLEEYANAEIDMDKMRARAAYGYHDDRFQAANMCFWAGHEWAMDVERTDEHVTETPQQDYQRYAPGLDNYQSYSDWKSTFTDDW